MPDLDLAAVLVATLAAFVLGGVYYAVLGERLAEVSDVAAARRAVAAVADRRRARTLPGARHRRRRLRCAGRVDTWTSGLVLGAVLWIGFPLVLWTGAMFTRRPREARGHPRRRLAGEAARHRRDREHLAVAHSPLVSGRVHGSSPCTRLTMLSVGW